MKLRFPSVAINPENGFNDTDLFRRAKFGQTLANLIENVSDPLVISLNAPWGEGKSTFIKQWQGMLDSDYGIKSIYFDAFESDYQEDAFLAVSAEIYAYAKDQLPQDDDELKNSFKDKTKNVSKALLKASVKTAVRIGSAGIVDGTAIDSAEKEFSAELGKVVDQVIDDALESHKEQKAAFVAFKETLSELAAQASEADKPLVFIIDELDRCKPNFALELLEKIKHVFSTPNLVFVLVNNKKQLEESVKCAYGQGIDANEYLQKFITLEVLLPKRNDPRGGGVDVAQYAIHQIQRVFEEPTEQRLLIQNTTSILAHINLTLRQTEKVILNVALYMACKASDYFPAVELLVGVCILKALKPDAFLKLCQNRLSYDAFERIFELKQIEDDDELKAFKYSWMWLLNGEAVDRENQEEVEWISQAQRRFYGERGTLKRVVSPLRHLA